MFVIAAEGLKVPTEADPRKYITRDTPAEIGVTAYYLRRLADRELEEVAGVQPGPTEAAGDGAAPGKKKA